MRSDLPATFKRPSGRFLPVSQTATDAGVAAPTYLHHGGGPSFEQTLTLKVPSGQGVTFVTDRIFPFHSANDAKWGFETLRAALARSGVAGTEQVRIDVHPTATPSVRATVGLDQAETQSPSRYEVAKVPSAGDQDAGFTVLSSATGGEDIFENDLVLLRQGRFCATVRIAGAYTQVPWSMAIGLARTLATRMRVGTR
jgi:hypothetical protein